VSTTIDHPQLQKDRDRLGRTGRAAPAPARGGAALLRERRL